eukprot:CAMPEP_0174275506 /NCGR_PEP_ID=MMETSP0439-20130205/59862_1 /TAXON_ID=0 /ORGANISM="Stereomyxa ramosa, Strain Chinc5" /LENGTH=695 /DNA_ID=CAMNT_0015367615 /DNA_START=362 /DNA_END=2446 /DNA_ORIENTATION=-
MKGSERLFVLKDESLIWFVSRTGSEKKAKGSMPLRHASVTRGNKTGSFLVEPITGSSIELLAQTNEECEEWMEAIKEVVSSIEEREIEAKGKTGFLIKKGKKRWFVIINSKLLWYNGVTNDPTVPANGFLLLPETRSSILEPSSGMFPIKIVSVKKSKICYTLYSSSQAECVDWHNALVNAGASGILKELRGGKVVDKQMNQQRSCMQPASNLQKNTASPRRSNSGVLMAGMQPVPRRTSSGVLIRNTPPLPSRNQSAPGAGRSVPFPSPRMSSTGANVRNRQNTPMGNRTSMICPMPSEAPPPIPELPPDLPEFNEKVIEELNKKHNLVVQQRVRASSGVNAITTAHYRERPIKKTGWLTKKGKKRWFKLEPGELSWFNNPRVSEKGKPNGFLDLRSCIIHAIGEVGAGYGFALCSESQPEYLLLASSETEMEDWIVMCLRAGAKMEKERKGSSVAESPRLQKADTMMQADKNGWLEKKSRRRWFILKNGKFSWHKHIVQDEKQYEEEEPAGYLLASQCSVRLLDKKIRGKYAFILFTNDEEDRREYLLLHPNEIEVKEWVTTLIEIGGAKKSQVTEKKENDIPPTKQGDCFGVPLEQLLENEGRVASGVPLVVEVTVEYIRANALDVEGIFRRSGEHYEILALKEEFDKPAGEEKCLLRDQQLLDPNAVAGVLKLFIRELDPPIMRYELYDYW